MKLNEDLWAIVCEDGRIAGDGESPCIHSNREYAEEELQGRTGGHLRLVNNTASLRVQKVRIVPVEGSDGK